jgi:hypothetical protein
MQGELYDQLNKGWKSTCRILFGEEIGDLKDYEEYLAQYLPQLGRRESGISGKKVFLDSGKYPESAKFISCDDITENTIDQLDINEIKDIDSIVEAITDKWKYCGNKFLGNSKFIDSSDLIMDSQYVYNSSNITGSTNIFSSNFVRRGSKYVYGSGMMAAGEFSVRFFAGMNIKRCFESHLITNGSDVYCSYGNDGCSELLFSFFQRNKRYMIGNLALPKDKYLDLKKKLLKEISAELKKNKKFPSLFTMVPNTKPIVDINPVGREYEFDIEPIEKSFRSTFKVLLGSEPDKLDQYGKWLSKHTADIKEIKTPFGRKTHIPQSLEYSIFRLMPKNRIVSFDEGMEMGKIELKENEIDSLEKIRAGLRKIGCFSAEYRNGLDKNTYQTPIIFHATNSYKNYDSTYSDCVAFTSMSGNSKNMFGCGWIVESSFCLNCYNSVKLSRCFEVDTSTNCSDSYFCHNSEGLSDAMFCWNAKGKRNAIGNLEIGKETYREIKKAVISQITDELEKTGGLKYDIFNMEYRVNRLE